MNTDRPECNGPVLVYSVPDYIGTDNQTEYKGFYILLPIDSRFEQMDPNTNFYQAKVVGSKQIVVTMPAWPFALWPTNPDGRNLYGRIINQVGGPIGRSMNAVHSAWDNTDGDMDAIAQETRKWKYVTLDFSSVMPAHGELSSKVLFAEAGEQELLDFDVIDVPAEWEQIDNDNVRINREETFLGFRVATLEGDGGRKVSRTQTQMSKLAQKRAAKQRQNNQG